MSDLGIKSAIHEQGEKLSADIDFVRDDLRGMLLAQSKELKRLQAVVWVLTQLAAQTAGVGDDELQQRIRRALDEVSK